MLRDLPIMIPTTFRRLLSPLPCLHICRISPSAPAPMSTRRVPPIPAAFVPPTGNIFRRGAGAPPPDPQVVGPYITACASGTAERGMKQNTVSTIEARRYSTVA